MTLHPLLLDALGLPADTAWPPDPWTLLGLAPSATPGEIERAVEERSAALRPYQLAFPQEVTEALNRLAQAYETASGRPPVMTAPSVAESTASYTVIDTSPDSVPTPPPAPKKRKRKRRRPRPAELVVTPPRTPVARAVPSTRREQYRLLVEARRRLRQWDAVGTYLADPRLAAMTRAEWIAVIAALRQLEDALPEEGPGGAVVALARSRPGLVALGEMSFARRELLRDDWRAGRAELLDAMQDCRASLGRPRARWRRWPPRIPGTLVLAASAAAIALIRLF